MTDHISDVSARAGRSRILLVLTVVLGIACVVLTFLLLRPQEEPELTTSAESSAILACDVLAEIETEGVEDTSTDDGWVVQNQLGVISTLGWTAAAHDVSFEEFQATMEMPREVAATMFSLSGPEFDEAMDDARSTCENLEKEVS